MAERGAPKGNTNKANGRPWTNAIHHALARYNRGDVKQGTALARLALQVVDMAMKGDQWAIKEIGERLDGKAVQAIQGEVDATLIVEVVKFGVTGTASGS